MSHPLQTARTSVNEALSALDRLQTALEALEREEWSHPVFDLMYPGGLVPVRELQERLYLYQTTFDLLEAALLHQEATRLDFASVGDFASTRFADVAWHLGPPRRGTQAGSYPGGADSRYLVQLDPEDNGIPYGLAYYFPFIEGEGYRDTPARRRALADAPDLFSDELDVVWYEREDLTLAEVQELLRKEAPWNSPVAAAERLGFEVLEATLLSLPVVHDRGGQLWRGIPHMILAIPLGPSSRPFKVSGDLVLIAVPLDTYPSDRERMWLLCRYLRADQGYSGAAPAIAEALDAQGLQEALLLVAAFGRDEALYNSGRTAAQPLPRVAVRFMDRLTQLYARQGHSAPDDAILALLRDDLPQLNLRHPFDAFSMPMQP